jgi:uncharacterized protein (TIGR02453 family)
MLELVAWINERLRGFAVEHVTDPAKAMYRIYRDTRFGKDKTPCKTHVGAMFPRRGLGKNTCAGYYVGVSHKGVEVAGGMYMPGPEELSAVRQAIAADPKRATKLLDDKGVAKLVSPLQGEQLARLPKGFEGDPASTLGGLLRRKQLYYFITLNAELATTPKLGKEVVRRFEVMGPAVDFLNDAVLAAKAEEEPADARPKRPEPMF